MIDDEPRGNANTPSTPADPERAAIDALTAAARATDLTASGDEQRRDFAAIALRVLAATAANLGGVEELLAARPGSWEAEIIRHAVNAVAPDDDLPRYRTDPIEITLEVNEILAECTDADTQYNEALEAGLRRYKEAEESIPPIDPTPYAWVYDITDGGPVARAEDAPAWSWEAWRAALGPDEQVQEHALRVEAAIAAGDPDYTALYLYKSPELAATHDQLDDERAVALAAYDFDEEALEHQREREWAAYGQALKRQIETDAATVHGLQVPIRIQINLGDRTDWSEPEDLVRRIIDTAIATVPSPADLPGTPLERLNASLHKATPSRD